MEQSIKNFHTQFLWKPVIQNAEKLPSVTAFILDGMGGSHLAADLLRAFKPEFDLSVFSDYGIPALPAARLAQSLFIASSYSGNTEEPIDFAKQAQKHGFSLTVIAKGGKLLKFAQENHLPYVVIPDTHIQPRSGLGFQILALAALTKEKKLLAELGGLAKKLKPAAWEKKGKDLAKKLSGYVPVVYVSARNAAVAYNWKIKFNETGKIPAFYNVFPELNHNEMTGFDSITQTRKLSAPFHFIIRPPNTPRLAAGMKAAHG